MIKNVTFYLDLLLFQFNNLQMWHPVSLRILAAEKRSPTKCPIKGDPASWTAATLALIASQNGRQNLAYSALLA